MPPLITYKNTNIVLEPKQTVLEALLAAGYDIPNACRAGACQSCKMLAVEGNLPTASQQGIKSSEKALGYFLSCSCLATEDLVISDAAASDHYQAKVLERHCLNENVLRVRIEAPFSFLAGQYITIWHNTETLRSYSIASLPSDGYIELHIKLIESGLFSPYAFYSLAKGDELEITGPMGSCIYSPQNSEQPIILAAIGTGLGPILGILRDALSKQHSGPIHLFFGAKNANGLYLIDELKRIEREHRNVTVTCVTQEDSSSQISHSQASEMDNGDIYSAVKAAHPNTKGYGVYLCGAQSFVSKLKKQCFLSGANMNDIHADAFVPCG